MNTVNSDMVSAAVLKDERGIVGLYKQMGFTDPDQIYAKESELLLAGKGAKQMGKMFMWIGVPLLIIPPAGILILAIGYFIRRQGIKKIDLIRAGTEAYCKGINIEYQPAPL
jgi:hypothetical protein